MHQLANKLKDDFGFNSIRFEVIEKGALSQNYVVKTAEAQFFLKQYRFKSIEPVQVAHRAKFFFAEVGVPVILPLTSQVGKTFFQVEGKFYALFPWINGVQFKRGSLPLSAIEAMGEMLGQIHKRGAQRVNEIEVIKMNWRIEDTLTKIEAVERVLTQRKEFSDLDRVVKETLEYKRRLVLLNKLKLSDLELNFDHVIHGDYHDHNIFFNSNGQVTQVFDFEKTGLAPRVFELIRSIIYTIFDSEPKNMGEGKIATYIQAYTRIYPIPTEELRAGLKLFYLKMIHSVWVETEYYLVGNRKVREFLEPEHRRLQMLTEEYGRLERILTESIR